MSENEKAAEAAIDTEDTDVCPGCGFSKFADEDLCFNCRREASATADGTWGVREYDNWCPHCKRNVYLTQGRHLCEEVMGYLFGIELEPARSPATAQPDAASADLSADAYWLREASYGNHACPNGHEHEGPDNMCAECEHRQCCANAAD